MRSNLRIIVTGLIAQYPLGGVAWDYFQYVLGLKQLGHDVYYVEDTGQWPYNPQEGGLGKECDFNVQYLANIMARYGLSDQWAYRFPWQSQWFGLSDRKREEVIRSADLLINVSGTLERPEAYRAARRLAYIDSDPVFTQVKLARGQLDFRKWIDIHDVQFSFGECLPAAAPETGHNWLPTRQPIVISEWRPEKPFRDVFTTVMNWTSYKPVVYGSQSYGQKDLEFVRFQDLPSLIGRTALEIAVNAGKTRRTPRQLLAQKGWRVVDPAEVCPDPDSYRNYIESSKAEWSVAKHGYVVGRCGWFSCRSACYLAAGRPVAVQDTGFGAMLPVGKGLLAFTNVEEAVGSIKDIEANYSAHANAARELAAEYFDARKVLARLIDAALNTSRVRRSESPASC